MNNPRRRSFRRWLWTGGLGLSVGWSASAALGEEVTWRAVPATPTASASASTPAGGMTNPAVIAVTPPPRPAVTLGRPAAALDRPVPLGTTGASNVRPVTFTAVTDSIPAPVFRAQKTDPPKAMPQGPDLGGLRSPSGTADQLGPPRLVPTPHLAPGTPVAPGSVQGQPAGVIPGQATPGVPGSFAPGTSFVVPPGAVLQGNAPLHATPQGAIPQGAMPQGAIPHGSDVFGGAPGAVIAGTPVLVGSGVGVPVDAGACGTVVIDPYAPCPAGSVQCAPCPTGVLSCQPPCDDPFEADPFADPDGCCTGSNHRFWISGEYLMWWLKGSTPPPLVVGAGTMRGPDGGLAINPNSSQILYGGQYLPDDTRSGGRFAMGWWFDDCHHCGIDAGFFFLGGRGQNFVTGDTGQPGSRVIGRPFIDATTGQPGVQIVAAPPNLLDLPDAPNGVQGTVTSSLISRLAGADVNLRTNLWNCCWTEGDLLGGFRFLGFDETLTVQENLTVLGTSPANFVVTDQFKVRNYFYGPQVGLDMRFLKGPWSLGVWSKVAVGNMNRTVTINGSTAITQGGVTQVQPGGLLALPSNIGRYYDNSIAVIPEVGLNLGYQITDGLRFFVGYNFLYASNVFRAADQVNLAIDPNQVPRYGGAGAPGSAPRWSPRESGLWAHGVSFGLEWRY